jgi:hypothetical protein
MNDMERIECDMLRVSDDPLQVRVETFNSLMFEFLSKFRRSSPSSVLKTA